MAAANPPVGRLVTISLLMEQLVADGATFELAANEFPGAFAPRGFEFLREFTGRPVAPKAGTRWLANFFRCGGKTDCQFASWNNIVWKHPDFHRPEFFGELRFA